MQFIYRDDLSPFVIHATIHGHLLGIRWYGMAYLASFALMYLFYRRAALRSEVAGLGMEEVDNLAIRIIVGVIVGGRLGFVVQQPHELFSDPLFIFKIWQGGMAFFGGLAGVIIAIWTFSRRYGISFLALTDVCALPAALGLGIGRIANFVNGELFGKPTGSSWGVIFKVYSPVVHDRIWDTQPRHPSQLYESLSHFILFGILFVLYRRWVGKVHPGVISFLFLIGYGILRLITDFYRDDDTYWGPLSDGQWFSIGIAVMGAIALYFNLRAARKASAASNTSTPAP